MYILTMYLCNRNTFYLTMSNTTALVVANIAYANIKHFSFYQFCFMRLSLERYVIITITNG